MILDQLNNNSKLYRGLNYNSVFQSTSVFDQRQNGYTCFEKKDELPEKLTDWKPNARLNRDRGWRYG